MSKTILLNHFELLFAKNRSKNTKYSRNETILKESIVVCKKTPQKNTKYSRNKTILKIGHHAKAIAFAKSSLWVKK